MGKLNWVDGSFLTPSLQNAYWGTGASTGHKHNGLDTDGSVPKVDLATDVDGVLPATQVAILDISADTWNQLPVTRVDDAMTTNTAQDVTGVKTFWAGDTTASKVLLYNNWLSSTFTIENTFSYLADTRTLGMFGSGGSYTQGREYVVDWAGLSNTTLFLSDMGLGSDYDSSSTLVHFDLTFTGWNKTGSGADIVLGRLDWFNTLSTLVAAGDTARLWAYGFNRTTQTPTQARYAAASPGTPNFALWYNVAVAPNGWYFKFTPTSGTPRWAVHGRISKQYLNL